MVKLEEELELARLHRFAPKSEKHVDRLFDEAEQVADEDEASGKMARSSTCRKTGFATIEKPEGKKRAASPCRNTCRASVSSMTLPTTRRPALLPSSDAPHG